jgi:peptidoglycan/xylan/chitin deacetylase (PgdA/CDA1 family)
MIQFRIPFFIPWFFPRRIWKVKSDNSVFLTFDDGPQLEATEWILDYLKQEGIKATFFCVGENVRKNNQLYIRLKEANHQIGNHTMNHEKATKVNGRAYLNSIFKAEEFIESNLFRPPYGRIPIWKTKEIRSRFKIIMWSWLSYDFDSTVSVQKIIASAKQIKAGDIIVFHDNVKSFERLKILLPEVVAIIKSKGLKFDVIPSPSLKHSFVG